MKLVLPETESDDLFTELHEWAEHVSSVISSIEVARAVRRVTSSALTNDRLEQVLSRIGLIAIDRPIAARAAALAPKEVRSLDAIHVATALELGDDLDVVVTYDARQATAAQTAGLRVRSPGRP